MKWITTSALDQWAGSTDARTTLSEVISRLVRAEAGDIQAFRFPTGDSAQIPGYDGQLDWQGRSEFVPAGRSVWEFGVTADYFEKAKGDYKTRTETPGRVTPAETTFVFVTPRVWSRNAPTLTEWEQEKRNEGIWRDIKVIDGVALETWFDLRPAVAANVARSILGSTAEFGARSTDEFWEEYVSRFRPKITEQVLLCDREDQAKEFLSRLSGGAQDITLRADSPDEIIAFAVAAIRNADPSVRKFIEARTLVLDSEETARRLARSKNMIFMPRGAAFALSGLLITHNPTLVAVGREDLRGNVQTLKRPSVRALSAAIETMGYRSNDASDLARTCGRSVTILQRRIPNGEMGRPGWFGARVLLPAFLAGGWDTNVAGDKDAVAKLAELSYGNYEADLLPFLKMLDPPFDREQNVWQVRAPVDAFVHYAHLLSEPSLERLRVVARDVFSFIDPSLEEEEKDDDVFRPRPPPRNSEWLRTGLANTLLQISVLHKEVGLVVNGVDPSKFVEDLINGLPGLAANHLLIASLNKQLPLLMEAAPGPLLGALELLLEGDGQLVRPMFRKGGMFSSFSPHTYLLWALEPMAWDPAYLRRVAIILAKLSEIDPGGDTSNRPINSLGEIFLPWHPNTNACLAERVGVLDEIIRHYPIAGWKLISLLLPEGRGMSMPNQEPRYREAGAEERENLTSLLVEEGYRAIIVRAIAMAGTSVERWDTIVGKLTYFPDDLRHEIYGKLGSLIDLIDQESRLQLWKRLLEEVNRHRAFSDADWSLKEDDLAALDALLEKLAPHDSVERVAWLFDDDFPDIPDQTSDDPMAALNARRLLAVKSIREADGDSAVLSLASRVKHPYAVAISLANEVSDPSLFIAFIQDSLGKSISLTNFASALSAQAREKFGSNWTAYIVDLTRKGAFSERDIAMLLLGWPDAPDTWDVALSLGQAVEVEYWQLKGPWRLQVKGDAVARAVQSYRAVNRPVAALTAIAGQWESLEAGLILSLLDEAITQISGDPNYANSLVIHHVSETFKHLATRADVAPVDLAKREYSYLPLLKGQLNKLTLHNLLASDPAFFVSVLSDVFRAANAQADSDGAPEKRARAKIGYQLLSSFETIPGHNGDAIDAQKLQEWIEEVRRLSAEADRTVIADQYIGHLLAHAPADPNDQGWPHRVIRCEIDRIGSDAVDTGFKIERFNMRGVYSKALFEGGNQERELASQTRIWAKIASGTPRTAAVLRAIADEWDTLAKSEDARAEQDQLRY